MTYQTPECLACGQRHAYWPCPTARPDENASDLDRMIAEKTRAEREGKSWRERHARPAADVQSPMSRRRDLDATPAGNAGSSTDGAA